VQFIQHDNTDNTKPQRPPEAESLLPQSLTLIFGRKVSLLKTGASEKLDKHRLHVVTYNLHFKQGCEYLKVLCGASVM